MGAVPGHACSSQTTSLIIVAVVRAMMLIEQFVRHHRLVREIGVAHIGGHRLWRSTSRPGHHHTCPAHSSCRTARAGCKCGPGSSPDRAIDPCRLFGRPRLRADSLPVPERQPGGAENWPRQAAIRRAAANSVVFPKIRSIETLLLACGQLDRRQVGSSAMVGSNRHPAAWWVGRVRWVPVSDDLNGSGQSHRAPVCRATAVLA